MPVRTSNIVARYGFATLMVVAAALAQRSLVPLWAGTMPFLLFFPAIVLAAWFGRFGPGLFAVVASAAIANWQFLAPEGSLLPSDFPGEIALLVFVAAATGIVWAIESMHRANARAQAQVAERRRSEEAYRASEERERMRAAELETIMEAVPAAVWITRDPRGRAIQGNRAAHELLRLPPGSNASLSAPESERPVNFEVRMDGRVVRPEELAVQRAARGEEVRGLEEEVRFADGTSRHLLGNATPLRDHAGRVAGAVAAFVDITERKRREIELREISDRYALELLGSRRLHEALATSARRQEALYQLTDRLHRAASSPEAYEAALSGIVHALGCDRASILLYDAGQVMRFVAWRGLSDGYRAAVEGHSPWQGGETDPPPIAVADVEQEDLPESLKNVIRSEGIRALAFIPLVADGRLIGKFMAYFDAPHAWSGDEMDLAVTIGRHVAFTVARRRDEERLRDSEQRLEQALAAGELGAWEWNIRTGGLTWSADLERIHGIEAGSFGGTFADFQRDIHPDDLECVLAGVERAVAERGEYHVTYRIRHPDGGERWLEAFGRLALDARGEPERLAGVCTDVTARVHEQADRDARLAREHALRQEAEKANRLKDEFLATLSHELRNPLNVILGYSEVLLRSQELGDPQLQRRAVEALRRSALNQSHLIRDLLDLSRLRSGKLTLNREVVGMGAAIHNAVETVRAEAESRRIALDTEVPGEPVFVDGDPLRLEQIVWNLLNNAVRFTPPGGRVVTRLRRDGEEVRIEIEDTGQGIEPEFLPHVFEMFRQADASRGRSHSGLGIGLALVRQLVELHGGSVALASEGRGRGTVVTVRLPRSAGAEPAPIGPPSLNGVVLQGRRVLVVDDSEDTVHMLRHLLELHGAHVATAGGGREALRMAAETEFDVILSDISMPGMDGFELLHELRALPRTRNLPVLALTGLGQDEDVQRVEREGFAAHLTKPVDVTALVEALQAPLSPSEPPSESVAAR